MRRIAGDRRHGRWSAATAAIVAAAVLGAPSASATIRERGEFHDTYSDHYDCGFPVEMSGEFHSSFIIREGRNRDETAFFIRDRSSFREVHTNTDTGEWFVMRGDSTFVETRATALGGGLFEFNAVHAGQPWVVEDSSGRVVQRDRGAIRHRIVFDTGGDDEPGGDIVQVIHRLFGGPHPTYENEPTDVCAIATPLVGP